MNKAVSVIIPVYNGEKYLAEAIDSVLAQSFTDFEIIIINDGSTDCTRKVMEKYTDARLSCYYQHNQGQAIAINHAISLTKCEFIALLDSDDIFIPNKLALQAGILTNMPQVDMVFGYAEQFISPELSDEIKMKRKCPTEALSGYLPSGIMFRKTCIDKAGSFDPQWRLGFFIDWYMRAKEAGLHDFLISEILFQRRIHDHNQGVLSRTYYHDYLRIMKAGLQRRKQMEYEK